MRPEFRFLASMKNPGEKPAQPLNLNTPSTFLGLMVSALCWGASFYQQRWGIRSELEEVKKNLI